MANGPNKTVGQWRQRHGFAPREERPRSEFWTWFFGQVQTHGRTFESMDAAEREFTAQATSAQ